MHKDSLAKLDEAARLLGIKADVIETLRSPRELMQARLTNRMDDGSKKSFSAWRCRYDDTRGPTKGGIRFHPDSNAEEVEMLAFWMTFKCAVLNLPYGGSKGAIKVDPHSLSKSELERLSRSYVKAFYHVIGPDRDIPAPDVYTNAMIMGWMAENRQGLYWTLDEIRKKLQSAMETEGRAVWQLGKEKKVSLRTAAYAHGLGRLAEALEAQGTESYFARPS